MYTACQQQKDSSGSVDFSYVQIVQKCGEWVINNPDFKGKIIIRRIISRKRETTEDRAPIYNTHYSTV